MSPRYQLTATERSPAGIDRIIATETAADLATELEAVTGVQRGTFVGHTASGDVTMSAALVRRLLRAARGERVEIGHAIFNADPPIAGKVIEVGGGHILITASAEDERRAARLLYLPVTVQRAREGK